MEARKEAWLAVSAVNLLFFRRWAEVLPGGHDYFLEEARSPATFFSLMLVILVLSALAWVAVVWARRSRSPGALGVVRGGFLTVVAFGLIGILAEGWVFLGRPEIPEALAFLGLLVALMVTAFWVARRPRYLRRFVPIAVSLVLVTSPLVPVMFGQGLYHAFTPQNATARFTPPLAGVMDAEPAGGRFLVIVFDEMDERLLFEYRPDDLALPELDRLRAESLHATHAYGPDSATLRAIPSLTTGRFLSFAQPHSIDGNLLTFRDGGEAEWRDTPTLFHDARAAGFDVGIAGNYHPYCRLFEDVLSKCFFKSHYVPQAPSFGGLIADHGKGWLSKSPVAFLKDGFRNTFGGADAFVVPRQEREISKVEALTVAGAQMAADPTLELVFLHINAPHPTGALGAGFGYFDPESGTYATGTELDYFDNLALVDSIMGRIRTAMTESGVWDDTTVLVTSDHGYRSQLWHPDPTSDHPDPLGKLTDHRVPFILKPALGNGTTFDTPFNLVLLRPFSAAILAGEIPDAEAAAAWLEANAGAGPAPWYGTF